MLLAAQLAEPVQCGDVELLALDDALSRLGAIDPRLEKVVVLRFFGGLTVDEIASFLDVSAPTVKRDWRTAKTWLYRELTRGETGTGAER